MGRSSYCVGGSLPPIPRPPPRPAWTAEEMEADAARYEVLAAKLEREAAKRARRKTRTTPEQRARKAARDYVRVLRRLLGEAAEAARWERITAALDDLGMQAAGAKAKAEVLRDRVRQRTAEVYARAAAGCDECAAYLADESADDLYRALAGDEVENEATAEHGHL